VVRRSRFFAGPVRWTGLLILGLGLLAACSGGADDARSSQPGAPAGTPFPLSTPDSAALPADAQPLGEGDFGLGDGPGGTVQGKLTGATVECDTAGFMHVKTSDGTFLAGVVRAGDWDCQRALDKWTDMNKSAAAVGVRHAGSGDNETLTLINDAGGSLTMRVSGAWRQG